MTRPEQRAAQMLAMASRIQANPQAAHRRLGNFILFVLVAGFMAGWAVALAVVWLWS